jgi:hypothetical protein
LLATTQAFEIKDRLLVALAKQSSDSTTLVFELDHGRRVMDVQTRLLVSVDDGRKRLLCLKIEDIIY